MRDQHLTHFEAELREFLYKRGGSAKVQRHGPVAFVWPVSFQPLPVMHSSSTK
jgi:hypothetical protein